MSEQVGEQINAMADMFQSAGKTAGAVHSVAGDLDISDHAGRAVNAAVTAVRQVGQIMSNAVRQAEIAAADNRTYPDGRKAAVEDLASKAAAKAGESVRQAEDALKIADTLLAAESLPKVTGELPAAMAHLNMLADRIPKDQLRTKLPEIAQRGDDVAAVLTSTTYGRDLLETLGYDDTVIDAIRAAARASAADSGDPKRAAAARAHARLSEIRKGLQAAKDGVHVGQGVLSSLAVTAGTDPRDAEIRRLRDMVATQRGHSRHA